MNSAFVSAVRWASNKAGGTKMVHFFLLPHILWVNIYIFDSEEALIPESTEVRGFGPKRLTASLVARRAR